MVALAANRNTLERTGIDRTGKLAANQSIFAGSIVMRNASGLLIEGAQTAGCIGVGRAEAEVASTASGVTDAPYRPGVFRYANSASTDTIATADIGSVCYIVDDQTVAKTSATGIRSAAGVVEDVDAQGVWVRFDEALTRALLS